MSIALITGSAGLIGSEACRKFSREGFEIVGIDNDMRAEFFGPEASTAPARARLEKELPYYIHRELDIRHGGKISGLFQEFGRAIGVIVHAAAQPSHDWAARDPQVDFAVNALGTLNLLEAARTHCPEAPFIFTSTNKVYGDTPNLLPLVELEKRWEIAQGNRFEPGIDETMSVDQTRHSLFGASKLAADVLVQEYGRYFGMRTVCFRGGCVTGPMHAGAELHGFLAYLMKCTVKGVPYRVLGSRGKQVRDNLHSRDLAAAFWEYFKAPRTAEVYNIGGGRRANCSLLEAIELCEEISGRKLDWVYGDTPRVGDHIWWITDVRKFQSHYPGWTPQYGLREMLDEICVACAG